MISDLGEDFIKCDRRTQIIRLVMELERIKVRLGMHDEEDGEKWGLENAITMITELKNRVDKIEKKLNKTKKQYDTKID